MNVTQLRREVLAAENYFSAVRKDTAHTPFEFALAKEELVTAIKDFDRQTGCENQDAQMEYIRSRRNVQDVIMKRK